MNIKEDLDIILEHAIKTPYYFEIKSKVWSINKQLDKMQRDIYLNSRVMSTTKIPHKYYRSIGTNKLYDIIRRYRYDNK